MKIDESQGNLKEDRFRDSEEQRAKMAGELAITEDRIQQKTCEKLKKC